MNLCAGYGWAEHVRRSSRLYCEVASRRLRARAPVAYVALRYFLDPSVVVRIPLQQQLLVLLLDLALTERTAPGMVNTNTSSTAT